MWHQRDTRSTCKSLHGKPQERNPHGILNHRCKDNVTVGLQCVNWTELTQGRYRYRLLVFS